MEISLSVAQVLAISRSRPHPPAPNSVVLGSITRLSPLQAVLSISVVDGIPLPAGEEFIGVIRQQDVRATEKDRVKIGDCFRGGDVVRGIVVSADSNKRKADAHGWSRFLWVMHGATSLPPHEMTWV